MSMFTKAKITKFGEDVDKLVEFVRTYADKNPDDYFKFFTQDVNKQFTDVLTGDAGMVHRLLKKTLDAKQVDEKEIKNLSSIIHNLEKEIDLVVSKACKTDSDRELCGKVKQELEEFKKEMDGKSMGQNVGSATLLKKK